MRVNMRKLQLLFPTKQNTIIGRYKSSPAVLTTLKFFAKLTGKKPVPENFFHKVVGHSSVTVFKENHVKAVVVL